jgi:phosphoglycolate phosphatase-like HAD superfamily hydrolase
MARLIFFDFDGTIVESAGIKTNAFQRLFASSEHVSEIVAYHRTHAGVSRYEKFEHIYKHFLKKPLSPSEKARLGEEFSAIVLDEILKAPLVNGAEHFLKRHSKSERLYVVSSAPHLELIHIMKEKGLLGYFKGVNGAPTKKSEAIRAVLAKERASPKDAVMVGDSIADKEEADKAGVRFIGRLGGDELSSAFPKGTKTISDLSELEHALEGLK